MSASDDEKKKEKRYEKISRYSRDILGDLTVFIDQHIREIQYVNYSIGALGVVLVIRYTYALRVFTKVQDIPEIFLNKGTRVRGKVVSQNATGLLNIRHKPWLNIKPKWIQISSDTQTLPVELAHVDVTPAGRHWLQENLIGKNVRFVVFGIQQNPDKLSSAVYVPKVFRNLCVNEELIELGLCKVLKTQEPQLKSESQLQMKLFRKLIQLESTASAKGIGLWKVHPVTGKSDVIKAGRVLKGVLMLPWTLLKGGYSFIKKIFKK